MAEEVIELTFDPFTLPTAQHRAGLAGFLVLVESMRRRKMKTLPEVSTNSDWTVKVTLTKKSLASSFNYLYDATTEEMESLTQRKDKKKRVIPLLREEKRIDPKTGKQRRVFIYPQIIPRAAFLASFAMPAVWLKLWREAIWGTLRGLPRTRIPYEERAEGDTVSAGHKVRFMSLISRVQFLLERRRRTPSGFLSVAGQMRSFCFTFGRS